MIKVWTGSCLFSVKIKGIVDGELRTPYSVVCLMFVVGMGQPHEFEADSPGCEL